MTIILFSSANERNGNDKMKIFLEKEEKFLSDRQRAANQFGVNFINLITSSFYTQRSHMRKKTVKSSVEKKLTNLLCCCTLADLRFTLCSQV